MRGVRLLCSIVVTTLSIAAPAWADGPVGSDPAQNFPLGPMPVSCNSQPDGAECQNAAIYYLDEARASLGQPAYALPADFTSLSPVDQDLILTDLDRTLYGLPAIPGRTMALDADASNGVTIDDDPRSSDPDFQDYTSNWAGAFPNLEAAYELWMYNDGPGGANLDCTPNNMTGCWGHRHDILWSFSGSGALAMGAAAGSDHSGARGYAMLLGMGDGSYSPTYTDTWATAQADGAGINAYNPGTPSMTVHVAMEGDTGSVSDSRGQVCTAGTCSFAEPLGQPVTLTATAGPGSMFSQWLGACSGSGTCTVTPQQSETWLGAYFIAPQSGTGGSSGGAGGPTGGAGGPSGVPGGSPCGSGGSPFGPGGSPSGPGGSGQTGPQKGVTRVRITRVTTSRGTIHLTLSGRRLVCTLWRRVGHRWARLRVSPCGALVTYRKLAPGRYRVTVTSGTASASRTVTLR